MAKRKNYTHVIITDEDHRPMAWSENDKQLCYCTDSTWQDEHHPVQFYTKRKAHQLILKSTQNRAKQKLSKTAYLTMPFLKPLNQ